MTPPPPGAPPAVAFLPVRIPPFAASRRCAPRAAKERSARGQNPDVPPRRRLPQEVASAARPSRERRASDTEDRDYTRSAVLSEAEPRARGRPLRHMPRRGSVRPRPGSAYSASSTSQSRTRPDRRSSRTASAQSRSRPRPAIADAAPPWRRWRKSPGIRPACSSSRGRWARVAQSPAPAPGFADRSGSTSRRRHTTPADTIVAILPERIRALDLRGRTTWQSASPRILRFPAPPPACGSAAAGSRRSRRWPVGRRRAPAHAMPPQSPGLHQAGRA